MNGAWSGRGLCYALLKNLLPENGIFWCTVRNVVADMHCTVCQLLSSLICAAAADIFVSYCNSQAYYIFRAAEWSPFANSSLPEWYTQSVYVCTECRVRDVQ